MKGLARLTGGVYAAATALVAGVVILCYDATDFYLKGFKGGFLLGNRALFLLGAALLLAAALGLRALGADRAERALARLGARGVLLASALVFVLQAFVAYCASFSSIWDARNVLDSAYAFGLDLPEFIDTYYLDANANNAFLAALCGALLRVPHALFGVEPSRERYVMLLTLLQSALNALSGALLFLLTRDLARRLGLRANLTAWGAYALYFALVACSPWFLVVYSDGAALALPVLLVFLYARSEGRRPGAQAALAALSGAAGGLAYLLKPQACVPLIAALAVDGARLLLSREGRGVRAARLLAASACALVMVVPVRDAVLRAEGVDPHSERALGVAEFFNMGLNPSTDGAFNGFDRSAALEIGTREERTRRSLETARERLEAFGPKGLAGHALRKALVNFSDGGFAYGVDFARDEREPRGALSLAVRSVVYDDGAAYPVLHTAQQLLWLLVLAALPFAALCLRGADGAARGTLLVMLLSALGILAFNMLFEAKARYLYVMAPVLLSLAALGAAGLARAARAFAAKRRG